MHAGLGASRQVDHGLARELVSCVHRAAERMGITVAAAVTDQGGHLVAAGRMDGAPFGAMALAIDKAYTAAALAAPTHVWQESTQPGGDDWGMQTSLAGRLIVYPGGLPLVEDGHIVGALGVSGGEGTQDLACARQAIADAGLTSR